MNIRMRYAVHFLCWWKSVSKIQDPVTITCPSETSAATHHLPDDIARECLQGQHKPLNPHSQKLLAASARKPKVPAEVKQAAGNKQKAPKPKASGKAKAAKASAKAKTKKHKVEVSSAEPKQQTAREQARVSYNDAKKEFFKGFLNQNLLFLFASSEFMSSYTAELMTRGCEFNSPEA